MFREGSSDREGFRIFTVGEPEEKEDEGNGEEDKYLLFVHGINTTLARAKCKSIFFINNTRLDNLVFLPHKGGDNRQAM